MKLVTASFLASATLLDSLLTMPCVTACRRKGLDLVNASVYVAIGRLVNCTCHCVMCTCVAEVNGLS